MLRSALGSPQHTAKVAPMPEELELGKGEGSEAEGVKSRLETKVAWDLLAPVVLCADPTNPVTLVTTVTDSKTLKETDLHLGGDEGQQKTTPAAVDEPAGGSAPSQRPSLAESDGANAGGASARHSAATFVAPLITLHGITPGEGETETDAPQSTTATVQITEPANENADTQAAWRALYWQENSGGGGGEAEAESEGKKEEGGAAGEDVVGRPSAHGLQTRSSSQHTLHADPEGGKREGGEADPDSMALLPPTPRARKQLLAYFALAVVCLCLALAAGVPMVGRPYDPTIPVSELAKGTLSNGAQLLGLYFQFYLGSLGVMLLANFIPSVVVFNLPRRFFFLLVAGLFAGFALAVVLVLLFLIEPQKTYDPTPDIGGNDPVRLTTGAFFLVAFFFLAALCLGIVCKHLVRVYQRIAALRDASARLLWVLPPVGLRRAYGAIALLIFLGLSVSCFAPSPAGAGQEYPGRYFESTSNFSLVNIAFSEQFVYKLFPDVLAFYLFVAGIMLLSIAAHKRLAIRSFLHRRVWVPKGVKASDMRWHPCPLGVAAGEVLLWLALLGIVVFWVCYWRITFTYMTWKLTTKSVENVDAELAARITGHLCNLLCGLLLLPASRTGLLVEVFAVPYERTLKYHRMLGMLIYVLVTVHAVVWWCKWAAEGNLGFNVLAYNGMKISNYRWADDDFTLTIVELSWVLLTASIVCAFFVRRQRYAIFQYTHKYIGIVFYITAIVHSWCFWYYSVGGLLLWLCDKWSRGVSASCTYVPEEIDWQERNDSTMIKISGAVAAAYQPGQYFFVNIPNISVNEWHPFTASAVLDDGIVFHIKEMTNATASARGTWTQRLAAIAQNQSDRVPVLRLSGPFGHTHFEAYEHLVLVAGGIGITPMIAIFAHLHKRQQRGEGVGRLRSVQLVWMSRSVSEFRLFEEIFALIVRESEALDAIDELVEHSAVAAAARTAASANDKMQHLALPDPTLPQPPNQSGAMLSTSLGVQAAALQGVAPAGGGGGGGGGDVAGGEVKGEATAPPSPQRPKRQSAARKQSIKIDLRKAPARGACTFGLDLYCTKSESHASLTDPKSIDYVRLLVRRGRCDLKGLFAQLPAGPATTVAVCGPPSLTLSVSGLAWTRGFDFHAEQFLF